MRDLPRNVGKTNDVVLKKISAVSNLLPDGNREKPPLSSNTNTSPSTAFTSNASSLYFNKTSTPPLTSTANINDNKSTASHTRDSVCSEVNSSRPNSTTSEGEEEDDDEEEEEADNDVDDNDETTENSENGLSSSSEEGPRGVLQPISEEYSSLKKKRTEEEGMIIFI